MFRGRESGALERLNQWGKSEPRPHKSKGFWGFQVPAGQDCPTSTNSLSGPLYHRVGWAQFSWPQWRQLFQGEQMQESLKGTEKSPGTVVPTLTMPASSSTHSQASWGVPTQRRRKPNRFTADNHWMELHAHREGLPGNWGDEPATTVIVCFRDKRAWGVAPR